MRIEDIAVLYQDHHTLIINKPAGVVIHPTYKHSGDTLWDGLLAYLGHQGSDDWQPPDLPDEPEWAGAPQHIQEMLRAKRTERLWREWGLLPRPCLLHRLDKDTSGVVALARTQRSRSHLVRQFHDHSIVKRYLAVVSAGAPAWTRPVPQSLLTIKRCSVSSQDDSNVAGRELIELEKNRLSRFFSSSISSRPATFESSCVGSVDDEAAVVNEEDASASSLSLAALGSDVLILDGPLLRDPADRRRCIVGPGGQEATTLLRVLAEQDGYVLLDVYPVTGRIHQIRAHLAAYGYAIVGDQVYAEPARDGTPGAMLKRQFLHAHSLSLHRFPDNALYTFVAPLAADLAAWLEGYLPYVHLP